jgi:hypothetical protein
MIEPFLEHRPLLFSTAYRMLGSVAEAEDAVASLMTVLAEDSTLMSDGGGRVRAALRPIQGAERIARFLFGIQKNAPAEDQHAILKMESLSEEGKDGRRKYDWSGPKRHPKNGLFAGRSLSQPQNG